MNFEFLSAMVNRMRLLGDAGAERNTDNQATMKAIDPERQSSKTSSKVLMKSYNEYSQLQIEIVWIPGHIKETTEQAQKQRRRRDSMLSQLHQ